MMLTCGCRAIGSLVASDGVRRPYCPIHDCGELMSAPPDLTGRQARCTYCKNHRESSPDLAFFQYRPAAESDSYYCGCRGFE